MEEINGLARRRQCTGTSKSTGERCGRAPIPGGSVCIVHGGNAAQVRQAAQRRLLAGADMAIDYLLSIVEPRNPCDKCGRSDIDRDPVVVRACQLLLDRAGYGPHASITLTAPSQTESMDCVEWMPREQWSQISAWSRQIDDWYADAKARMDAGEPRPVAKLLTPMVTAGELLGDDEGEV